MLDRVLLAKAMTEGSDPTGGDQRATLLSDGRRVSGEELVPIVYEDLRRLAEDFFKGQSPGLTIQPTALVHEAYLRLADHRAEGWDGRSHFLAVAAKAMRQVLSNAARDRGRLKRGGSHARVTLTGREPEVADNGIDILELEEALTSLGKVKERYAQIVELRYFGGLSIDETARVLGVSPTIVDREWAKAKAYLTVELAESDGDRA